MTKFNYQIFNIYNEEEFADGQMEADSINQAYQKILTLCPYGWTYSWIEKQK